MQIKDNTFCCKKCKKPLKDNKYEYCALCRTEIAAERKKGGGIVAAIIGVFGTIISLVLMGCKKK